VLWCQVDLGRTLNRCFRSGQLEALATLGWLPRLI
jgi:hypothetical protein